MRILVTGATGFIGSHFVNAASAAGHQVLALRRPGSVPRIQVADSVRWLERTLASVTASDCDAVDAVAHFAAHGVSPKATTWQDAFESNVLGSVRLLETANAANVSRFILCGSCVEYGPAALAFTRIPPSATLNPIGAYAASKAAACIASVAFAKERKLSLAYLRVFQAFGDGQHRANFWPSLRMAAISGADYPMTKGEQIRDFMPVEEVAATFLNVCENRSLEPGRPEVHNVGTGTPLTILSFAEHWWRVWAAKGQLQPGAIPYRPGEVMRYVPELTLQCSRSTRP